MDPFNIENSDTLYCIASGAPVPSHIEFDIMRAESVGKIAKE